MNGEAGLLGQAVELAAAPESGPVVACKLQTMLSTVQPRIRSIVKFPIDYR